MKIFLIKTFRIVLTGALLVTSTPATVVFAQEMAEDETSQEETSKATEVINLLVGDVQSIDVNNLSRVAVTNPEIVDISDAKADKVFVVGKKAGQTELFVWDNAGKRGITIRVSVEDLDVLITRLNQILEKANIKGLVLDKNVYEGKVILSGEIPKKDNELLEKIIEPFSDSVINLVKEQIIEDLVQVDVQIIELSTTLVRQLGLDWKTSSSTSSSSSSSSSDEDGDTFVPSFKETSLPGKGKLLKVNSFGRTTPVEVAINALVEEGKGRVLSNPRLVVVSGKEASFLVGGETPIRTTTTNATGGQSQENVSFKQYGINMTITPTIRDGKIDIVLNVQVSDVDKSTQNSSGDVGFVTRQAQTQLFLDDKQNIVLAGLIKHADGQTVKGLPFLSKIPVVGAAFRTRSNGNPDSDTELVISLTPTILKTKKYIKEQTVLPSKRSDDFKTEIEKHFDKETLPENKPKEEPKMMKQEDAKASLKPVLNNPSSRKISDTVLPYVRNIQLRISKAISYPYEAAQKNWEGTVKLRLRILKDGSLADCDLLESSGHDVFDKDALNTARIVAPYSIFPEEMSQEDIVVTVPIVYNQRDIKDDTQTVVASY